MEKYKIFKTDDFEESNNWFKECENNRQIVYIQ